MPLRGRRRRRRRRVATAAVVANAVDNDQDAEPQQEYAPPPEEYAPPPEQAPEDDMATQFERLGELHDQGVLTDEEFAAAKQKVLDS